MTRPHRDMSGIIRAKLEPVVAISQTNYPFYEELFPVTSPPYRAGLPPVQR
ncbi:hypothetical protein BDD14_3082 [Edaphobacter modestus]|uniref:Uncharacterized protein n=1 Tax=Edaphobacter modestus TaxID=388466 RepID=A0A4Q7YUU5_9BACT|nr:hypothetical protein BDD14_3082 [Edaphobacter modestus]